MVYLLELFNMHLGKSKTLEYKTLAQLQHAYSVYSANAALVICSTKVWNKGTGKKTIIRV